MATNGEIAIGTDTDIATDRKKWELDQRPVDVLAIGSQVVYGTVGLSSSRPVLESNGLKVAALPTALLGTLPHYPTLHAASMEPAWITGVLEDLEALGVADEAQTIYTGYFASPQQVAAVADWLETLLERLPDLRVIVDPTLGDYDVGFYTDPGVATSLRARLLPLATGIVPNVFELGQLGGNDTGSASPEETGAPAITLESAITPESVFSLMGERAQWAAITSVSARGAHSAESAGRPAIGFENIDFENLVVTRSGLTHIPYERIETSVKGTGDAMAASIVCGLHEGLDIVSAVRRAGADVRKLISATPAS
ncbi:MAG: bifunctional hydroxymethylpyrimidine kinase/phosphomethylpyrimidine kinase [Ancrocorticia sp.]|uniref:bifunctional hydroxymethylpyrimidine kinase/phosphomethylpyrimidine kinase n=1 Tax=Ancrocorticia sp. TaxID=2593684 RepID=UPI003F924249